MVFTKLRQFQLVVLCLRPLGKSLSVHQGQLPPAWGLCSGVGSQGVIRMELAKFTRLKQLKIWPCGGRMPVDHEEENPESEVVMGEI